MKIIPGINDHTSEKLIDYVYITFVEEDESYGIDLFRLERRIRIFPYKRFLYYKQIFLEDQKPLLKKSKSFKYLNNCKYEIIYPPFDHNTKTERDYLLPPILVDQFPPEKRTDIDKILKSYGMHKYDLWELAKRGGYDIIWDFKIRSILNKDRFPKNGDYLSFNDLPEIEEGYRYC